MDARQIDYAMLAQSLVLKDRSATIRSIDAAIAKLKRERTSIEAQENQKLINAGRNPHTLKRNIRKKKQKQKKLQKAQRAKERIGQEIAAWEF